MLVGGAFDVRNVVFGAFKDTGDNFWGTEGDWGHFDCSWEQDLFGTCWGFSATRWELLDSWGHFECMLEVIWAFRDRMSYFGSKLGGP